MGKFLYNWRYYSFGKDLYLEYIDKLFINNLNSLRQVNILAAGFMFFFSLFPLIFHQNFVVMGACLLSGIIAVVLALYLNYKMQTAIVNTSFIYVFTTLFYVNIMTFSIYLGIFAYQDNVAALFLSFLLCALLMFVNPPVFNLYLTLGAMAACITCSVLFKPAEIFIFDIVYTFAAGILSLFFTWHITKLRIGMELSTSMLEEERNKYLNQSTIDELTQLNNRRDFFKTFSRYISSYRTNDDWLCVAILDIDFFKNYNDHYGHPKGDECLRSIGSIFNKIKDSMGVYAARVGGEEFAMLWFEKDASHVDAVVSKMSGYIKDLKIPHEKSKVSEYVTMSMGVYVAHVGEQKDVQTLYDLADKALYAAKGGGRNCAVINGKDIEQYKISANS